MADTIEIEHWIQIDQTDYYVVFNGKFYFGKDSFSVTGSDRAYAWHLNNKNGEILLHLGSPYLDSVFATVFVIKYLSDLTGLEMEASEHHNEEGEFIQARHYKPALIEWDRLRKNKSRLRPVIDDHELFVALPVRFYSVPVFGVDSRIGEYSDGEITLNMDYGWYSNSGPRDSMVYHFIESDRDGFRRKIWFPKDFNRCNYCGIYISKEGNANALFFGTYQC
ncbi:MAG: hypothetical protein KDC61_09365, partial [Saprospiraceae bacterium]|nr:hypothetical protein [Saprospiraceae bacterium]